MADLLHYVEDGFASVTEFGHDKFSVLEVAGRIGATYRAIGKAVVNFRFIIWLHNILIYLFCYVKGSSYNRDDEKKSKKYKKRLTRYILYYNIITVTI